MAVLSEEPLVAAVVRLDDRRRQLQSELQAEEGVTSALRTELDATRAQLGTTTGELDNTKVQLVDAEGKLAACRATRQWLNDRVTQLEKALADAGVAIPPAPTPKP